MSKMLTFKEFMDLTSYNFLIECLTYNSDFYIFYGGEFPRQDLQKQYPYHKYPDFFEYTPRIRKNTRYIIDASSIYCADDRVYKLKDFIKNNLNTVYFDTKEVERDCIFNDNVNCPEFSALELYNKLS